MAKNPWEVPTLEDFLYYCCPECDCKVRDRQSFVEHALIEHQEARDTLLKPKEDDTNPKADLMIDSSVRIITTEESIQPEHVEDNDNVQFQTDDEITEEKPKKIVNSRLNYSGDWQCYVCGYTNQETEAVINHVKKNHYEKVKTSMYGPVRNYQCEECKLVFMSKDTLGLHVCGEVPLSWQGKSRNIVRKCSDCEKTFKTNYALLRHIALKHKKSKNFPCDQCDYKASLPTLLKKHKVRKHSNARERNHLCNQCGEMYLEKTQLWSHIAYIHGKSVEDYMCYTCGKVVRSDSGLKNHLKNAHGSEVNRTPSSDPNMPYKCESCKEEFSELEDIRKHFREHHRDEREVSKPNVKAKRRYSCPECDKKFYTKNNFESHFNKIHTKERRYPCTQCHEAFYDARSLKVHNDQHDGINQHKCHICMKHFKTKYLRDRHIKSVHEKSHIYVCDTCGFKTYHQWSLTAHVQQVHQKLKPNKCDVCEDAFFYKRDKERHMAKAHGSTKESW